MATFTNKVEALLGDSPTQADLDLALMEAAAQVYGDLGDSNIEAIATREDIPADGLSLNGRRLGGVVTEHGRAFQIDPSRKKSFRHGERTRPVYFVEGSTVYVQPDHVECQALLLDVPTTTGEAEAKDPQLQILFALQAAQHIIQERMAEQQRNIQDVGTLPNVPAAPSEPTFTYTDAAEISPTATTIGNLPAAPQLTVPSDGTKPDVVTIGSLDLSTDTEGNPLSRPSLSLTPSFPTPPTAPDVAATFPDAPTKPSVPAVDATVPTYNGPTDLSLDYTDFDAYFDLEDAEMGEQALGKLQTEVQAFQSETSEAVQSFQSKVDAYNSEIQGEIQQVQAVLQEYQADVDAYVSEVQSLVEQEGLEVQAFQAEVQAFQSETQAEASRIQSEVRAFEGELQSYRTAIETKVQEFTTELDRKLQQYQAQGNVESTFQQLALEGEQARVQAAMNEFQAEVEKEIQQAQLVAQEAQQTAQNAQEVELQNAAQQLQADVQEYGSTLQQYDADLQRVQLEIEKTFREAEIDTQQRSKRLEMMAFDLRRMRSRYKRHLETYRRHHRASTPHRIVSTMY